MTTLSARFFLGFFLACVCLWTAASPATAQQVKKPHKATYSETEKVGFAFYKLADQSPPVEEWLKSSEEYKLARASLKRDYIRRESQRLAQAFSEYDINNDLIHIRTPVRIKIPSPREQIAYEKMDVRKPVEIIIDDVRDNFFPVQVGDMWVAVVANDLDKKTLLSVSDEQFKIFSSMIAGGHTGLRKGYLELRLIPRSVDVTKPLRLDDLEAWLMLADIASMTIWRDGDSKDMVWEQTADWYTPPNHQEILNLYRQQ